MNQFTEFFKKLFDVSDWPPRWVCGVWSDFHGWLYIGSDVAIWLAYFIIPVILIWFVQKKPNVPFLPVFWLFGAFILLCGTTHFLDAIIFWWPGYRISALVKFLTALVSFITVFALIRDLPRVLSLSSPETDESGEEELKHTLLKRDNRIAELEEELARLKSA